MFAARQAGPRAGHVVCYHAAHVSPDNAMTSLSRQLARWIVGLRYEDLPPEVVDRAKGLTLHGLASVLLGSRSPDGAEAVKLIVEEEAGVHAGATIMVNGTRVTKGGAAFANAEMAYAGGKWDTFRMLTHPGTSIIPGASSRRRRLVPRAGNSSPPSRRATRSWSGWRPISFRR